MKAHTLLMSLALGIGLTLPNRAQPQQLASQPLRNPSGRPSASPRPLAPSPSPTSIPSPAHNVDLPFAPTSSTIVTTLRDDASTLTYYLDWPEQERSPLVLILQGSECLNVYPKYRPWIERFRSHGMGVLRIEKRGLGPTTPSGECPEEYLRRNTLDGRQLDVLQTIAELRAHPRWDGRLLIVGGSEGAMVAALVAALIPETRAVAVLVGGGGWTFEAELVELIAGEMSKSGAPPEAVAQQRQKLHEQFAKIKDDSTWKKEWGSDNARARNTYRYWDSALERRCDIPLLRLKVPILLVHGDRDLAVPVSSADALQQAFVKAGKGNLEYRRIPGMGHGVTQDVLDQVETWLHSQL